MKAVVFHEFGGTLQLERVPDPTPPPNGVVLAVKANGICRSDWHGWMGHDSGITLPHVPGHECAGEIVACGAAVKRWKIGDRVVVPFSGGCGSCPPCQQGHTHICDHDFQPGFTAWGAFAEYVAVDYADVNLVRLPEEIAYTTAASLGCRFMTSWWGLTDRAQLQPEEWIAIHGCGGVGLSCMMIARSFGARVIAVDINKEKLALAKSLGAEVLIDANNDTVVADIHTSTRGGAHVSVDALGHPQTAYNSVACLRKRGRHVQIGLAVAGYVDMKIPMNQVIGKELILLGSHGMPATAYPTMLRPIRQGDLQPQKLISHKVSLEESKDILAQMGTFQTKGVVVIDRF